MKTFKQYINEDAPAVSVGAGAVAGMPTASPPEQTPVPAGIKTSKKMLRRKPPKMFGGRAVFSVPSESYHKARLGKGYKKWYKSYVSGELGEEIRQYALQNPDAPIILEDEKTGAMMYLKYGKR